MRAMVLDRPGEALVERELPDPRPEPGELVLSVSACAICRTDLHIVDGELAGAKLPLVPGHQVVGVVEAVGAGVESARVGQRVGVPWLGWTCGECAFCRAGRENLCDRARFTGFHRDGGYAERAAADARFVFALPEGTSDVSAAPLLCAGLIGYRAYRMAGGMAGRMAGGMAGRMAGGMAGRMAGGMTGRMAGRMSGDSAREARRLGFYGFGAAAHLLAQVAVFEGREVYAFTRPGDLEGQRFARGLGAVWAGGSDRLPPEPLDAAILFAPVGALVPAALAAVRKGGAVVCAGIHMSEIPAFSYELLWGERTLASVANLTRRDGEELLALAPRVPLRAEVEVFPLARANEALAALRSGRLRGAGVLTP